MHAMPGDPAFKPGTDKTWQQALEGEMAAAIKTVGRAHPSGIDKEMQVKRTYLALEQLAKYLYMMPGQRDIVWITDGVVQIPEPSGTCSGDYIDCSLYIDHLANTLDHMSVSLNPGSLGQTLSPAANRDMEMIAGLLNGRTFFSMDPLKVVSELKTSAAHDYLLIYRPAPETLDKKFHKIRVSVERKGVKLTARNRLFAFADSRPDAAKAQNTIVPLMNWPGDDSSIGIQALNQQAPDGKTVQVQMKINAGDLQWSEDNGSYTGHITMIFAVYNAKTLAFAPTPRDFNLKLTRAQYDEVMKNGLPYAQQQPIDATVERIKVIVYDNNTGLNGSLTMPVKH
jgi:hypothetical protein